MFSLRIFCTIQIHLSLSEKFNRENLKIGKFEERGTHMLFCGKFLPNFCQIFPYFFLLRIFVLELSARLRQRDCYTSLKG